MRCLICRKKITTNYTAENVDMHSHNAWPLTDQRGLRVCNSCNTKCIIPLRMAISYPEFQYMWDRLPVTERIRYLKKHSQ